MARTQSYEQAVAPSATAGSVSPSRRAYRYRGVPKPDPAAARAEELLELLVQQRKMIALRSSRLRALSSDLHDRVAQAVCDGVKVALIAQAARVPATAVRGIGAQRDELYPSGQSAESHLHSIAALAGEVTAAGAARAAVEQTRARVLATARKLGLLDDYQLACASGLKHEEIRKMTRGVSSTPAGM